VLFGDGAAGGGEPDKMMLCRLFLRDCNKAFNAPPFFWAGRAGNATSSTTAAGEGSGGGGGRSSSLSLSDICVLPAGFVFVFLVGWLGVPFQFC
jgi:hypothetical protein